MKDLRQVFRMILLTVQTGTLAACQTDLPNKEPIKQAPPPIATTPEPTPVVQPPQPPPPPSIKPEDIVRICGSVTPGSFDSTIVGKRSIGEPCATVTDKSACQRDLNEKLSLLTEGQALVIQKDGASAVMPISGVSTVFGSVDAVDKALAILLANGQEDILCDGYVSNGVQFRQSVPGGGCGSARVITVSSAGAITDEIQRMPCKGRRPEGLHELATSDQSSLGAFFARAAWEEAASVPAFHLLARDLVRLGAPADLSERAFISAEDEVRHAEQMSALAARFGARVETPHVTAPAPKALLALAIENMREGCINETFAALLARYQAENASDPSIAEAMLHIAEDEAQHAMLAWEIYEWAMKELSLEERQLLQETQRSSIERLAAKAPNLSASDAAMLGWPDATTLSSLATALKAELC